MENPIYCAVDMQDLGRATQLAARIGEYVGGLKLGLEFFCAHGPRGIAHMAKASEKPIFLDLKLHDIPNTVAGAVRAVVPLKPRFLTLHALGGPDMLKAAKTAVEEEAEKLVVRPPALLAVTVLTSHDQAGLGVLGIASDVGDEVRRLALMSRECGLDGVVCSPLEVAALRADHGSVFTLMVPGVRPTWADVNDHERVMSPADAINAGADHLVIGRPITGHADPAGAARTIYEEIAMGAAPAAANH